MTVSLPQIGVDTVAVGTAKLNAYLAAKTAHYTSVTEYGVTADGSTDDLAAFQACIDAVPDWSTIILPPGPIRITDSVSLNNRRGLRLIGAGMHGASSGNTGNATKLVYDGSNDGSVITMDGTRDSTLEAFAIDANGKAAVCIDVPKSSGATQATSFNRFIDLYAQPGGPTPRTNWRGIQVAIPTVGNCEGFIFRNCLFYGGAATGSHGIHIGGSGDALIHSIENCEFYSCDVGAYNLNGSFRLSGALLSNNLIDIQSTHSDPIYIEYCRSETASQFYVGTGGPVHMRCNSFASYTGTPNPWIDSGDSTLIFEGNIFNPNLDIWNSILPFSTTSNGRLVSIGNTYKYTSIISTFDNAFLYGVVSLGDIGPGLPQQYFSAGNFRDYGSTAAYKTRFLLANKDYFGALNDAGAVRQMMGLWSTEQMVLGDPNCATRFRCSLATPATLADGDCWIDFTGTTPNRQLQLNVRDGGATYSVNIGAAH